jgi:hypothetical protein
MGPPDFVFADMAFPDVAKIRVINSGVYGKRNNVLP